MQKCIHEEHSQLQSYKDPVSVEGAVKNQFHHVSTLKYPRETDRIVNEREHDII